MTDAPNAPPTLEQQIAWLEQLYDQTKWLKPGADRMILVILGTLRGVQNAERATLRHKLFGTTAPGAADGAEREGR